MTEPLTPPPSGPDLGDLVRGIWRRDPTVIAGPDAPAVELAELSDRFGWLDAPAGLAGRIDEAAAFATRVREDGITDVILLGMGGSSLCSEVLRDVRLKPSDGLRFTVLETTDEDWAAFEERFLAGDEDAYQAAVAAFKEEQA